MKASRPNVVLISIDTLRADHLSPYGYFRNTTQNINDLAKQGVLFENEYSLSPHTAESHMSLMTSLHHEVHHVHNWIGDSVGHRLDDSIPTLAEILKKNGYATGAFTGGGNVHALFGFDRGFDVFRHLSWKYKGIEPAVEWVKEHKAKHFFLFYHTYNTHFPYLPSESYNRIYDKEYKGKIPSTQAEIDSLPSAELPELLRKTTGEDFAFEQLYFKYLASINRKDPRDLEFLRAQYDATIKCMDEQVIGRLIKFLKEQNLFDNTLLIITSDHGEAFHEHKNIAHDDLFKETLHIPLIIVFSKGLPKNKRIKDVVRTIDVMPTILDILKIKVNSPMQGVSLLPAIRLDKRLNLEVYSSYYRATKGLQWRGLRNNQFSFIEWSKVRDAKKHPYRLYDSLKTPREIKNIFRKEINAPVLSYYQERIKNNINSNKSLVFHTKDVYVKPDPETLKKIKSLGYVE